MSHIRRRVYFQSDASSWTAPPSPDTELISGFHKSLPNYEPTRLVSLDNVAKEVGVGAVYIKEECSRLGLPSFKVLGASWGTFRAVVQKLGLPPSTGFDAVKQALSGVEMKLFAATAGNHGRAVARIGALLSVPVEIHVPSSTYLETIAFIESEGAVVIKSTGSYEDAMATAFEKSKNASGGILVQDTAFDGYEDIPSVSTECFKYEL